MASVPRIFFPQHLTPGQTCILPTAIAHRLRDVLRLQVGDGLFIFNDQQEEFSAYVVQSDRNSFVVRLGDRLVDSSQTKLRLTLIQGISKSERMDYTVQKATELGVHEIIPVLTGYSQIPRQEKYFSKRLQHWQGVMISAAEQCGRRDMPSLHSIISLQSCLDQWAQHSGLKLIAEPAQAQTLKKLPEHASHTVLIVGPEGGFSSDEIAAAKAAGFIPISIGPRILRTETVAPAVLAILQYKYGDLG